MTTFTCTACHQPVDRAHAVLRGNVIDSTPAAWHRYCWELRDLPHIPAPRVPTSFASLLLASA